MENTLIAKQDRGKARLEARATKSGPDRVDVRFDLLVSSRAITSSDVEESNERGWDVMLMFGEP